MAELNTEQIEEWLALLILEDYGDAPLTWQEAEIAKQREALKEEMGFIDSGDPVKDAEVKKQLWDSFLEWKEWLLKQETRVPDG